MRTAPLLLALLALAAAGAAGWVLLRPAGDPAGPGPGAPPGPAPVRTDPVEGPPLEGPPLAPSGSGTLPGPRRNGPRRPPGVPEPLRGPDAWKQEKDGVPPRDPKPLPEGVSPGEFIQEGLSEADERGVAAVREKMLATPLEAARYHGRSLESLAKEISAAAGLPVELSGEDLADEPVEGEFNGSDAFDRLMQIAVGRNLRMEIRPDRVVLRR